MRTDHPFYLFLSAGAEAFRVLTGGLTLVGPYRFTSVTLKSLERRIDGLFSSDFAVGPRSTGALRHVSSRLTAARTCEPDALHKSCQSC